VATSTDCGGAAIVPQGIHWCVGSYFRLVEWCLHGWQLAFNCRSFLLLHRCSSLRCRAHVSRWWNRGQQAVAPLACSCTLLRSHPAACDARPRALYRPWRTQHRSHDKRLSVRRPAPGHRRRGRDCRHALPSPHVVARRRRRPVAGSSCRLRLLTRQRSWRRRGSAGGGVSAVDTLHERAQHAAPAGTAAGRSVEGRPRMHECYTRECGVNAASRPAPRGARARCPRRAVSARLRVVCERTVLNLPHGGLMSCFERRPSLLSAVTPGGSMHTASEA